MRKVFDLLIISSFIFAFCGMSDLVAQVGPGDLKIYGGNSIDICSAPYQVSLHINGEHGCGGTILSNEWVLTAAHCVEFWEAGELNVLAGSSMNDDVSAGQYVGVDEVIIHEGYLGFQDFDSGHDLALLHLDPPLEFNDCVDAIALVGLCSGTTSTLIQPGSEVFISGWGTNDNDEVPDIQLLGVSTDVISADDARNLILNEGFLFSYDLTNNLSLFFQGAGSGSGDSGGPAVVFLEDGTPILVGTTSWGCGVDCPSIYVDNYQHQNWIIEGAELECGELECEGNCDVLEEMSYTIECTEDGAIFTAWYTDEIVAADCIGIKWKLNGDIHFGNPVTVGYEQPDVTGFSGTLYLSTSDENGNRCGRRIEIEEFCEELEECGDCDLSIIVECLDDNQAVIAIVDCNGNPVPFSDPPNSPGAQGYWLNINNSAWAYNTK